MTTTATDGLALIVRVAAEADGFNAGGTVTYRVYCGDRWVGWVGDGREWRGWRYGARRWWACWRETGDTAARWHSDLTHATRKAALTDLATHMATPPDFEFTRPGAHSAKNARQAGAPNHLQGSGENPMVDNDTTPVVLTADVVLLHCAAGYWRVLLIQRGRPPFTGCWALPGGGLAVGETVAQAACRELAEETGLTAAPAGIELVGVYDTPGRDPRGRVVSAAFVVVLPEEVPPVAGDDAAAARWVPVNEITTELGRWPLAFDHAAILGDAVNRAQRQVWENVALDAVMTLSAEVAKLTTEIETTRGEREEIARESDLREREILTLIGERDTAEAERDRALTRAAALGSHLPASRVEGGVA